MQNIDLNLTALTSAILTIMGTQGRIHSESSVPMSVLALWKGENGVEQLYTDVSATLRLANMANTDTGILTLKGDNGEELGETQLGTILFTVGQDNSMKFKVISVNTDEDDADREERHEMFNMRFIRVIPDGKTVRREFYGEAVQLAVADGYDKAMQFGMEEVTKRLKKAKHSVNIEFELSFMDEVVGTGTASGKMEATEFNENTIAQMVSENLEITTMRHRKDVMSIMAGMSVREFVRDGMTGEAMKPETLRGFQQEGVYAKVNTLVVMDVQEYRNGQLVGTSRKMVSRVMHEPAHALEDYADRYMSVFINSALMQNLQEPENYEALLEWVKEKMKRTAFPYFMVGRKKRLIFSRTPWGEDDITKDFERVNVNRSEHFGQLVTARGIKASGSIPTPELVDMKVPDGVYMALNLKLGMMLGLTEGVWQVRGVRPYVKGTIVVSRFIKEPFLNKDAIKVKPEEWPTMILGDDIIAIRNSDDAYDMRFSHQLGYLFVDNFLESKGQMKPWGMIPELMAQDAVDETTGPLRVKRTLPTEYSRLQAFGLPYDYYRQPEDLEEVLVRAFRPKFAKLTMFVALPIERLDPKYFDKVGMYMPAGDDSDYGRYWVRIPALAVGGAMQDLHTEDANGERILCEKFSPMLNVTVAAIHEPKVIGKDVDGEEILQFPDDVELGGAGRSRIIWSMMAAMGADSDGDMTGRTFVSIDRHLRYAGLKTDWDVPLFKTKLPYKGIDGWSEEMRGKMWAVSTPKLANVGMGDVMTQRCVDLIFEGHMQANVWQFQRRAGAQKTQSGVSAPKYDTIMTERALLTDIQVNSKMRETGTGDGFKGQGLLFQPTIDAVRGHLKELFPEAAQWRQVTCTYKARKWEGGMSSFLDRLANFDEQMGDFWVTYVKDSFKHELRRMITHGIQSPEARNEVVRKFATNFRDGHARHMVRGYVAHFIQQHPDKHHIWAWMLDAEFIRPQSNDRRPDGLPLTTPNLDIDNTGHILELMGMPFDLERLNERAAKLKEKEEERKDKKRNK